MSEHPIIESVRCDIEGLDFADDDKRQGAEDSIICTVQTLIDRLATAADALAAQEAELADLRAENKRNATGFEFHAGRAEKERARAESAEAQLEKARKALELTAGALQTIALKKRVPVSEQFTFTGKWACRGTVRLGTILDTANEALAARALSGGAKQS